MHRNRVLKKNSHYLVLQIPKTAYFVWVHQLIIPDSRRPHLGEGLKGEGPTNVIYADIQMGHGIEHANGGPYKGASYSLR